MLRCQRASRWRTGIGVFKSVVSTQWICTSIESRIFGRDFYFTHIELREL